MESEDDMEWKQALNKFDVAAKDLLQRMTDKHQPKDKIDLNRLYKAHIELRYNYTLVSHHSTSIILSSNVTLTDYKTRTRFFRKINFHRRIRGLRLKQLVVAANRM